MANKGLGSSAMLAKIQLTRDAVELRKQGDELPVIAGKLGVSVAEVRKCIETAVSGLESAQAEEAAVMREIDLLRLDALFKVHFEKALRGDHRSSRECREIMAARARLAGLNKPIQIEQRHIIEEQVSDEQLRRLMEEAYLQIPLVGEGSGE